MAGTPANVSRFNVEISGLEQSVDVLSFEGRGGISQLYEYQIECCTSQAIEPLTALLQSNVCLTLVDTEQPHFIHGIIRQAQHMGSAQALYRYRFTLVPRLWYLTQRKNQRLFQQQTIPAIVKQVLQEVGIGEQDVSLQLSQSYSALDLVTQYNETDYAFLSRLMANQGMHFHFRHHADHHQLLIADHNQAFADISGQLDIRYMPEDRLPREQSLVRQLHQQQRLTANQLQVGDFSYQQPGFDLSSRADLEVPLPLGEIAQSHYRSHQYGGEAQVQQQVVRFAGVLRQQQSMQRQEVRLVSDDIRLQAGYCFAIKEHGKTGLNQRWLLARYEVKARQPQSAIQLTAPQASVYNIKAHAIVARQPFVAPACFVKPGIGGVQTAFVTGPADEEIYTDKLGRVKLQFHWDRQSAADEGSSAWVRCRQTLAGKQWGSQRIPRIGEEVLVRFEESDPDRPVVVGALCNADNKPPFPLPKEQARSGLQTCSTPKGKDYQEISINDQQGEEQIRIRGSRDLDLIVQRNRHELVQGDWHLMIGGSQYQYLAGNAHAQIKKSARQRWRRDLHRQIGGNYQLNVNGAQVSQVTQQVHLKAGSKLVLETEGQLSVSAGASFITLDASGITIGGPLVRLNEGGGITSQTKAAKPQVAQPSQAPRKN